MKHTLISNVVKITILPLLVLLLMLSTPSCNSYDTATYQPDATTIGVAPTEEIANTVDPTLNNETALAIDESASTVEPTVMPTTTSLSEPAHILTPTPAVTPKKVGISLPTMSLFRWLKDGSLMKQLLKAEGYEVQLEYAGDNDIPTQKYQIEKMIADGCDILVIKAIDSSSLTSILQTAGEKNIPIIGYDSYFFNENIDIVNLYHIRFDIQKGHLLQVEYMEKALNLPEANGPFYIELFDLSYYESNFHATEDAKDVIKSYVDCGQLVIKSGQIVDSLIECYDYLLSHESDQERINNLFSVYDYYPDRTPLDAVWCAFDSQANVIIKALLNAGYTKENFPIITGNGADKEAIMNIIAGTQAMTVFQDTKRMAEKTVEMAVDILNGKEPEFHDTEIWSNSGNKRIPIHLVEQTIITIDNYKEVLLKGEYPYYTEADLT